MALQLTWSFTSVAFIFTGIVLVNGAAPDERISLVITPHNETVYPGTNVIVTCRISLSTGVTVSTLVRILKVVKLSDGSIPTEPITTLTSLATPYKNLARYEITRTEDHSDMVYTLTISGVTPEDSGSYSCSCDTPDIYAWDALSVYSPPKGISFPGFNASTVVELTEGEATPQNLMCLVSHVMPKPAVQLTVDGRVLADDSVHLVSYTNAMCANIGVVGKSCPLHQNYNVTVVLRDYKPLYTDDGRDMVCTSQMKEFNRTVNTATVHLSVRYAPKISCLPVQARVNASNVWLTCTVYANPFLPYNRTWIVMIGTKNFTLMNNTEMGGEFELTERMDRSANPKKADVALKIRTASADRFKHKYYLKVENEIGETEVPVRLEQFTATSPGGSGSPAMSRSGWTSLTLMMSSILLYFRGLL